MHTQLFIGGNWVCGEGAPLAVLNPASEEIITQVDTPSTRQIEAAVQSAHAAQRRLRRTSGTERAQWLETLAQSLTASGEALAQLESRNVGKPLKEAALDIQDAAACLTFYARLARELDAQQNHPLALSVQDFEMRVRHEPVGVAALIIPWNFPLLTTIWKVAPAIAAGCACIVKPSEFTPLSALALAQHTQASGWPEGILSVLNGEGARVGETLCQHERVAKISFTGSTATGRRVAQVAAAGYKRVTLEAGGKSPIIIFDDVPVESAVEWIMFGAFFNQGEVCNATSRVLVHRSLHAPLVRRLVAETNQLILGSPDEPAAQMGPLQNRAQLEKFERYVALAKQEGARWLCGGQRDPTRPRGLFVRPAIFDEVPRSAAIWREEVFGPLLAIRSFATEEEAIELANDSDYGLAAAVLSQDAARAERVACELEAGCVWLNCSGPAFVEGPWGGFKRSGIGRELGRWGLDAFLEPKQLTAYTSARPWGWYLT